MKKLIVTIFLSTAAIFAQDPSYSLVDLGSGLFEALALDINNQGV